MPATVIPALAQAVVQANDESFTQKLINSRDFVADAAARKAQEAGAYLVSEAKATPGRIGDAAVRKAKETGEYVVSEAKATPGRVAESIEKKAKETIDEITTAPKKILDEIKGVANGPSKKDK